jgi:ubiquinone biosynthesis monooxygenase Coq7
LLSALMRVNHVGEVCAQALSLRPDGLLAGQLGDRISLGFLVETERQVEQHLAGHLDRLPASDARSRAIVQAMQDDERRHADDALAAGGDALPSPVRWLMRGAAKLMTTTAARI